MPLDAADRSPAGSPGPTRLEAVGPRVYSRLEKLRAVLLTIFCLEMGAFLLLVPWMEVWQRNFFGGLAPWWSHVWASPYFRGAVSGLGMVNIGIGLQEIFRLRRFARPAEDAGAGPGVQ